MRLIITPEKVAETAFCAPDFIQPEAVSEATILAAQQKFVRPVLGDALYEAVCGGAYPAMTEAFLRPPLALYVKMLMLPSLAVQAGGAGIVEVNSRNLARAGEGKLRSALRRLRCDARALMRRAVRHIESAPADYPEYDPTNNILNRCSTEGGLVLTKDGNGKRC